jgi:hypothetical protein
MMNSAMVMMRMLMILLTMTMIWFDDEIEDKNFLLYRACLWQTWLPRWSTPMPSWPIRLEICFLVGGVAKFVTLAHGSLFTVFCILECCCRDSFGVFFCGHLTRHLTLTDAVGSRMRTRTRMFVLWKFSIVRVRV